MSPDRTSLDSLLAPLALLAVGLGGCIPTAARTQAKVTDGFEVGAVAGVQTLFEGRDENGEITETKETLHLELDFQQGWTFAGGDALALQVKVPATVIYSAVDLYYQLPDIGDELFLGFGAELSIAPGIYAVLTQYLGDDSYVSVTPRLLSSGINPQIAVGLDLDAANISLFASYLYFFGDGIDIDIDFSFESGTDEDRRTGVGIIGFALRL